MASLLILIDYTEQKLILNKKNGILGRIFTKKRFKIFFFSKQKAENEVGDHVCMFL